MINVYNALDFFSEKFNNLQEIIWENIGKEDSESKAKVEALQDEYSACRWAMFALAKEHPVKVIRFRGNRCYACKMDVGSKQFPRCPYCGNRLDWS